MRIVVLGAMRPHEENLLVVKAAGHDVVYLHLSLEPSWPELGRHLLCVSARPGAIAEQVLALHRCRPVDVVLSLLNHEDSSARITAELLDADVGIPIVRQYKEHLCTPEVDEGRCLTETAAQIYINEESLEYFHGVYGVDRRMAHCVDLDTISSRYMGDAFSSRLSERDGEPHLAVVGTVTTYGDHHDVRTFCVEMAERGVHVHIHGMFLGLDPDGIGRFDHAPTRQAYADLAATLPRVHLHDGLVPPARFTESWSCYDAGVMHMSAPPDAAARRFAELNYPMRISAYLAAGLPLVQPAAGQAAMRELVARERLGLVYETYDELSRQLRDVDRMRALQRGARSARLRFTFESRAPRLFEILTTAAARGRGR